MSCNTPVDRSAPNTALVISYISDDPARVLTAIQYAALDNRRVVLAQVASAPRPASSSAGARRRKHASASAQISAATKPSRWASTWSAILSRVFLLGNIQIDEIPVVARDMEARRLVLSSPDLAEEFWHAIYTYELADLFDASVWVLGRNVPTTVPSAIRRILVPLSLRSGFEGRLRTASQLAREAHATLAILHVVPRGAAAGKALEPWEVNSRLQRFFETLSDAPCPLEISFRDGDPAEAILKFDELHPHDVVLLRSAEGMKHDSPFCGVTRRILNEASCPVLLTPPELEEKQSSVDLLIAEGSADEPIIAGASGRVQ